MAEQATDTVAAIVHRLLSDMGYDFVRMEIAPGDRIQIMIERHDRKPIVLDDCEQVSRALNALPAFADAVGDSHALEVSSPGIDRPLVRRGDYQRYLGFVARFHFDPPLNDGQGEMRRKMRGRLQAVEGDDICFHVDGRSLRVPFESIQKAQLVLDDDLIAFSQSGLRPNIDPNIDPDIDDASNPARSPNKDGMVPKGARHNEDRPAGNLFADASSALDGPASRVSPSISAPSAAPAPHSHEAHPHEEPTHIRPGHRGQGSH